MSEDNATPEGLTVGEGGLNDAQKSFINSNFRAAMSSDNATHAAMADYQDLDGWAKSHINQQKLIGGEKLPKPSKKWGKQEWADFNKQIGMPKEAKDYELDKFQGADEDEKWFREYAHNTLNLSKRQAKTLWKDLNSRGGEKTKAYLESKKAKVQEGANALKEEWGGNYDAKVKFTNEAIARLDKDGRFRAWMKSTGLNQEPEMLRFAAKVAESFAEDRVGSGERPSIGMSKEAAKAKLNKIFSEASKEGKKHPLYNKKDPAHKDAVAEVTRLSDIAGGGGYNG